MMSQPVDNIISLFCPYCGSRQAIMLDDRAPSLPTPLSMWSMPFTCSSCKADLVVVYFSERQMTISIFRLH